MMKFLTVGFHLAIFSSNDSPFKFDFLVNFLQKEIQNVSSEFTATVFFSIRDLELLVFGV